MIDIPLESVVANYFGEYEYETELSLATLAKIRIYIEGEFHKQGKFVRIDMCRDSIQDVSNSRYFSLKNNSIIFNNSKINEFYEDLYCIYNSRIDKEIKYEFLTMFEEYIETLKKENIRQKRKIKLKEIKKINSQLFPKC